MRQLLNINPDNAETFMKIYVNVVNKTSKHPRKVREHIKTQVEAEIEKGVFLKKENGIIYLNEAGTFIPKIEFNK